ncbi:MAG: biotin/lipoate A/B protein ligase family protein [Negativicutes bacterium]|nr:biotin/lipoate A/B protein ligase family protein [Negativicutes bacterium]
MRLYRLGAIPWDETQAIYHALAEIGQEGLIICRPTSRCVCLGLHDDLSQEVDTGYCRENGIPLIRRDIGGGTVLLDWEQLFFQLVISRDNPLLTGSRDRFFAGFLRPAVNTLGDFNLAAAVCPPADIVVNGRKISGSGAGDISGLVVYTGNILLAFDRKTMANVLKAPNARFRDLARTSMEHWLTTMGEELGYLPDIAAVEERLIDHFATWLGELQPAAYTAELKRLTRAVARRLTSREFLGLPGKRSKVRQIKINEGTYLRFHQIDRQGSAPCGTEQAGTDCSGYVILLIQNGIIRDFEGAGIPWLAGDRLAPLAPYLTGVRWQAADLGVALARWRRDCAGDSAVAEAMLSAFILNGQEK